LPISLINLAACSTSVTEHLKPLAMRFEVPHLVTLASQVSER
jgi:hypothetical protein